MVSDLNIVTGDLEALSTDVSNVATEISGVNVTTDMADAPSAMPGSSSAGSITSAAKKAMFSKMCRQLSDKIKNPLLIKYMALLQPLQEKFRW